MKRKIYSPTKTNSWSGRRLYHSGNKLKLKSNKYFKIFKILSSLFLISALSLVFLFWWVSRDLPTPEGIARRLVPQSTKIYDRTGKFVLYDIHGEVRRTSVGLSAIPETLKQATLVAEDRTFYQHKGFRFASVLRSLIVNLLKGGKVQGGSTITQQFIKNAILTNEKLYSRKIKEIILAYQIEKKFSKDEILKLYFNEIPYGSNAYGAEAAAQSFFGKSVSNLNLAESAILAAIPKAPTYYSPWGSNLEELIGRQHYILDEMVNEKYITENGAEEAKKYKLNFIPRRENIIAPHFIFFIKEQLANNYGEKMVEQGGLKVISTLDLVAQTAAEEVINSSGAKNLSYNAKNTALVALDTKTSQILAMVGSRDYFDDKIAGQVNVTTRPRQPGSSFKPIVYAAAFAKGYLPETLLFDVVTDFKTDTKDYTPHNYDNKEHGLVSLRQALAGSLNIPAVKLLYLTGLDNVLNLANRLGYTTLKDKSRFGLSLVLGGAEVKLLEHTNFYATLAREGKSTAPIGIIKVEDDRGNTLEEAKEPSYQQIIDKESARQVTDILSDNSARSYIFGTNNYLTLNDRPVAAKTGTTNNYRDAWTLGYTPSIVCGVWVGNSNNEAMKKGSDGSVLAAPIWHNFMQKILKNKPIENFTKPQPKTSDKPMLGGQLYGQEITIDRLTGKLATEFTPPSLIEKKKLKQYHTILHYLNKNDPVGLTPPNFNDIQYQNWEAAVRKWATANNLIDEQPPSNYDDVHTAENRPNIYFLEPINNQTITSNPFVLRVNAISKRGVKRVVYLIDGQLIGESTTPPFDYNFTVQDDLISGYHNLTAWAYDDVDNSNSTTININLLITPSPSLYKINWLSPIPNSVVAAGVDLKIEFTINHPESIEKIDLFDKQENGQTKWIGVIENPTSQNLTLVWQPSVGYHSITALLRSRTGLTKRSLPLIFTSQ